MNGHLRSIGAAVLAMTALAAGAASARPSIEVKDAVARVVVIPEARSDIKVEVLSRNPALPLEVRTQGGRTIVDGGLRNGRINACNTTNGVAKVRVRGVGEVRWDDIPQIVVRTPLDTEVAVAGAVFGSVGRSDGLTFANAGCGDWTIANVKGRLNLSLAGSGDTKGGSARKATVNIAGSGDVSLQAVSESVDVNTAGSGDTHLANITGALSVQTAGSGDVTVEGGHASRVDVSIAGSGGVDFGGVADSLSAQIMGSGDVRVRQVTGAVNKSVMGSGDVTVGR